MKFTMWGCRASGLRGLKVAVIAAAIIGAGCARPGASGRVVEDPKGVQALLGPPAQPPAVPPRQKVSLDASLRIAAQTEIDRASQSKDKFLRAHAIEAARLTMGPAGRQLILKGLSDPDVPVRFAAAMAVGDLKLSEAYEPLIRMVNEKSINVRIAVIYALHRLGDKTYSSFLQTTAKSPDMRIRANTVMVLGRLNEPTALRILQVMETDKEAIVRIQVAEAMWRLGEQRGLNNLIGGAWSKFPDDQIACLLALVAPGNPEVIQHVRGALVSDYAEVSLTAARAMGMLGSDEGMGVALIGVGSSEPRQRALAAMALGAIGRSDAQDNLRGLLSDANQDVRLAAAIGILQLKAD